MKKQKCFLLLYFCVKKPTKSQVYTNARKAKYYRLLYLVVGFLTFEPFGFYRFAMGHSLSKAAKRPLFVRARRYAPRGILVCQYDGFMIYTQFYGMTAVN